MERGGLEAKQSLEGWGPRSACRGNTNSSHRLLQFPFGWNLVPSIMSSRATCDEPKNTLWMPSSVCPTENAMPETPIWRWSWDSGHEALSLVPWSSDPQPCLFLLFLQSRKAKTTVKLQTHPTLLFLIEMAQEAATCVSYILLPFYTRSSHLQGIEREVWIEETDMPLHVINAAFDPLYMGKLPFKTYRRDFHRNLSSHSIT